MRAQEEEEQHVITAAAAAAAAGEQVVKKTTEGEEKAAKGAEEEAAKVVHHVSRRLLNDDGEQVPSLLLVRQDYCQPGEAAIQPDSPFYMHGSDEQQGSLVELPRYQAGAGTSCPSIAMRC